MDEGGEHGAGAHSFHLIVFLHISVEGTSARVFSLLSFFFFLLLLPRLGSAFQSGPWRTENRSIMQINTHACPAASGRRRSNRNLGKWPFCDQATDGGLLFSAFFFFFLFTGSSLPPCPRQPRGTRGQGHNYFAIFPAEKNRAAS